MLPAAYRGVRLQQARDEARAEDVTQEAFLSALRRLRVTDSEINFKPWIYEIARNATIDSYRRSSRAEEISMDRRPQGCALRPPSARGRQRARLHADRQGAHRPPARRTIGFVHVHARVLVMRELEGCSYREIGEKLDLTRPAVESALFRARRRLETEYAELSEGRRCRKARAIIARLAEGMDGAVDHQRLAWHARRRHSCRRWARELGVEPQAALGLRAKVAALLPLPFPWLPSGTQLGAGLRRARRRADRGRRPGGRRRRGNRRLGAARTRPGEPAAIERETVGERTTARRRPARGSPRSTADKRDRDGEARRSADRARAKRDAGSATPPPVLRLRAAPRTVLRRVPATPPCSAVPGSPTFPTRRTPPT